MSKKCLVCQKSVYPMDPQINLDGSLFHKGCAKCADCQCQITISNFTKTDTTLLCKTHYFKRFNEEGSYLGGDKFVSKSSQDARKEGGAKLSTVSSHVKSDSSVAAKPASYIPKSAPVPSATVSAAPRSFLPSSLKGGNNSSSWIRRASPEPASESLPTPPVLNPAISKVTPTPVVEKTEPVVKPSEPVEVIKPAVEANEPAVEADEPTVEANEPVVEADEPAVEANEPAVEATESAALTVTTPEEQPSSTGEEAKIAGTVDMLESETFVEPEVDAAVIVDVKEATIEALTEETVEECESV